MLPQALRFRDQLIELSQQLHHPRMIRRGRIAHTLS
jgi:hypothetical protein